MYNPLRPRDEGLIEAIKAIAKLEAKNKKYPHFEHTINLSPLVPEIPKIDLSSFIPDPPKLGSLALPKLFGLPKYKPEISLPSIFGSLAPKPEEKRKVFISYYHKEDQLYKNEFDRLFGNLFINKSVQSGDINEEVDDNYIKRLIQENYIDDASVVIVLVGAKTYYRKHVDWEIAAGLNKKVGGLSGLVGILLPSSPHFSENKYYDNDTPFRLLDNLKSGYAKMYQWTDNSNHMKSYVEEAFKSRIDKKDLADNSRKQLKRDLCD